ncbi:hypothetical protein NK6_3837 [Bradyrhizobium diazoefficiens]|uniref:Uncharacterized protein n=1 Tax=Bradyrhizobium diazoefficiens TaxID=1355477 RepID=A0A0E4BPL6_9BRAD|nr:hypothetical protein NK6_3837 [Bradyrhizobium diazoefficiens]
MLVHSELSYGGQSEACPPFLPRGGEVVGTAQVRLCPPYSNYPGDGP